MANQVISHQYRAGDKPTMDDMETPCTENQSLERCSMVELLAMALDMEQHIYEAICDVNDEGEFKTLLLEKQMKAGNFIKKHHSSCLQSSEYEYDQREMKSVVDEFARYNDEELYGEFFPQCQ